MIQRRIAFAHAGCILIALTLFSALVPTAAAFSNGQDANLVLGQADFTSATSGTTQHGMGLPQGVAVDPASGKVFVADRVNNRVLRFAAGAALMAGAADGVLGQPGFTTSTSATLQLGMNQPAGVAVDRFGTLWVADTNNNRVLRFDDAATKANGAPADGVLGQPGFTTLTAATTANGMNSPSGVAVDSDGTLWIADTNNSRVLRFNNAAIKANGAPANGVLGQPNLISSAVATTQRGMDHPVGIAADSIGQLWVADKNNNRVLRFASAIGKANGAPADGVLGQAGFAGNGPATTQSGIAFPSGVAVDSIGTLWVAELTNNRVLRFDGATGKANGANADGVLGQINFTNSTAATTATKLNNPTSEAVDSAGRLWVADTINNRVLRFTNPLAANLVLGQPDFTSSLPAISATGMSSPTSVAIDPTSGKVFVADQSNNRVLRFASGATLVNGAAAEAVLGQVNFSSFAVATTATGMNHPGGVAVDNAGHLWVADLSNSRILRFDNAAIKTNGAPADGVLGQPDFTSFAAATTQSGMDAPRGVAVDSAGRLWVADRNNSRVLRFDIPAAKTNGAPANGVLGQLDFTSFAAATTQRGMNQPAGLAVDSAGRLWVADATNNRVLRFDGVIGEANGALADGVLGQPDFTSNTAATTQSRLTDPFSVAVDNIGTLWIADTDRNRVLRFDDAATKGNGAPADGVLGQFNFTTSASNKTQSGLNGPFSVAVDSSGALWVADTFSHRVLRFTKLAQTITFGALANKTYGSAAFKISATASSGLAVAFSSATASVCSVSDATVTLVSGGTCTITADQAGDASDFPAPPLSRTFIVSPASQAITFGALANKTYSTVAFKINATASSGLTVTLHSATPRVCSVSGAMVTMLSGGMCTITASQAGNASFNAAKPVTQSFKIQPVNSPQFRVLLPLIIR